MWPEIVTYAGMYESAVLTVVDAAGYPYSRRCRPQLDGATRRLRLALPADVTWEGGPACLLWHRHDHRLWNLHSFAVRGVLERDGDGWAVRPEAFIPGMGIGGWRSYLRFLVHGRRTTQRYLARRGLARPKLNWQEWSDILREVDR